MPQSQLSRPSVALVQVCFLSIICFALLNLTLLNCLAIVQEKIIQQSAPYETQLLDCASNTQLSQLHPNQRCKPVQKHTNLVVNNPIQEAAESLESNRTIDHDELIANRSVVEKSIPTANNNFVSCQLANTNNGPNQDLPLVICSTSSTSSSSLSQTSTDTNHSQQHHQKPIQIYIVGPPESSSTITKLPVGSSAEIQCRFNVHQTPNEHHDLRFKLRWLRLVASSPGQNQSISNVPLNSNNNEVNNTTVAVLAANEQASIHVSTMGNNDNSSGAYEDGSNLHRHWTIQRHGGLDLVLNDFKPSDSGQYFCQAIAAQEELRDGSIIVLDEKRINLMVDASESGTDMPMSSLSTSTSATQSSVDLNYYSQDNLAKLLPSLKIHPEFVQVNPGETVQLACVTSNLDPDPELSIDSDRFEWSFEPIIRPGDENRPNYMPNYSTYANDFREQNRLPSNVSQLGNILIIWSTTQHHCGIYKCQFNLPEFNLSSEATGELRLRPPTDSAPLVFVEPELLRLSPNGSASLRCESTGFPVPQIDWYRVDNMMPSSSTTNGTISGNIEQLDGIRLEQIDTQDSMAFCEQLPPPGCVALTRSSNDLKRQFANDKQSANSVELTRISLLHIEQARAEHQGQYACKASNKHGSNQASSIVDVEYRQLPLVKLIGGQQQLIQLPPSLDSLAISSPPSESALPFDQHGSTNVTFKCTIEGGRPKPRLRWLRAPINHLSNSMVYGQPSDGPNQLIGDHHSIFNDLNRISSATSKVSTWFEDQGQTLALSISTISLDDEGEYVCLGENELGKHSAVGQLIVQQAANLRILQPSPKVAKLNSSFQLDCLASGHPVPQDIEWSRSDRGAFFALITDGGNGVGNHRVANSIIHQQANRATLKFDQVTLDEAGEYTCAARDSLNSTRILRDTIMLLVGEQSLYDNGSNIDDEYGFQPFPSAMNKSNSRTQQQNDSFNNRARQLPKLIVRPTKVNALIGSNVTLDCLAISGIQPTLVEWLPPSNILSQYQANEVLDETTGESNGYNNNTGINQQIAPASLVSVRAYYRSRFGAGNSNHLLQFGSKLHILNVSKSHEGVYQCKGRNRIGVELAPALIKLIELPANESGDASNESRFKQQEEQLETKTKVAKLGSNIELRCQVNGVQQQPATSWSRDGRELPRSSVQIGHNLWIQNLTQADEGLYLCSARSSEPNRVIQAKINLLVRPSLAAALGVNQNSSSGAPMRPALNAKIVASKGILQPGDSVTLECILSYSKQLHDQQQQQSAIGRLADRADNSFEDNDELAARSDELDELEKQIIWTNLHSGETLFQDNVYIQNNLLIIYNLRLENSAIYRCNYNDLSQHADYKLTVSSPDNNNSSILDQALITNDNGEIINLNQQSFSLNHLPHDGQLLTATYNGTSRVMAQYRRVAANSKLTINCPALKQTPTDGTNIVHHWNRSSEAGQMFNIAQTSPSLVFESITSEDADSYQCQTSPTLPIPATQQLPNSILINVQSISAKFVQRPCSFISLPALANNEHQVFGEIELKFLPESNDGLILFSGRIVASSNELSQASLANGSHQVPTITLTNQGDYVSLGLQRGYVEFKFELGDGSTLLRSPKPISLNQWHRLVIERNRRGATMWLDGRSPISNSSQGKFFNLNLNSVLFVGGHQVFLQSSPSKSKLNSTLGQHKYHQVQLNGYSRGFQGCISSLLINRHEMDLIARNRSASIGVYECDKSECKPDDCSPSPALLEASITTATVATLNGICQVDRSPTNRRRQLMVLQTTINETAPNQDQYRRRQSLANWDLRCICLPGFMGPQCSTLSSSTSSSSSSSSFAEAASSISSSTNSSSMSVEPADWNGAEISTNNYDNLTSSQPVYASKANELPSSVGHHQPLSSPVCHQMAAGSATCNPNGTLECQQLSSSSFRCHCRLGSIGERCDQVAQFGQGAAGFSVGFNRAAYLQFRFSFLEEFANYTGIQLKEQVDGGGALRIISDTNNYHAQATELIGVPDANKLIDAVDTNLTASEFLRLSSFVEILNISFRLQTKSSFGLIFYTGGQLINHPNGQAPLMAPMQPFQASKSVVANQLIRLIANRSIDFLAIGLVDGHLELSLELGSGLVIIRSTRRINDGQWHQIQVQRLGRQAKLIIDEQFRFEGHAPGRLSMLNGADDIYLGGLPHFNHHHYGPASVSNGSKGAGAYAVPSSTGGPLLGNFSGCLSQLRLNSLGPLNLIANSSLVRIKSGRNLVPCSALDWSGPSSAVAQPMAASADKSGRAGKPLGQSTFSKPTQAAPSSKRPSAYIPTTESEPDDSDESG